MPHIADIARLNVLIELFSECANADDLDTLLRVAAGRLRWIVEFDRCVFAVQRGTERRYQVASRGNEALEHIVAAELHVPEALLIDRVFATGAPGGEPAVRICVPIQVVGRTLGALCFSSEAGGYTYRDMRLGHHAGQYLGSLISRMDLAEETALLSRRKDDLLALLSHELRNPLAPIVTAVQLLRIRDEGRPSKELDIIDRQAQHLVRLVDDLLDVARLARGKMALARAPVEIAEVIARAVEMVGPLLDQRRHVLALDVAGAGLGVDADANRLVQVVSNLLTNAAHYTEPGGHVTVAARREHDAVVVDVADDGIGLAPESTAGIFDLFVQGAERPGGHGGLGLGLAVVKQLTELHCVSVEVASAGRGRGSTFTVRLPWLPLAAEASSARSATPDAPRAGPRQCVLIVDDNADALELLAAFVSQAGHEVVTAPDGPQALEVLAAFHPTIAVIDIGLPGMDGHELAGRIRALGGRERPYLVALTGYGQAADRARSRAAGFDEHLVKPVDPTRLLAVIAQRRAREGEYERVAP